MIVICRNDYRSDSTNDCRLYSRLQTNDHENYRKIPLTESPQLRPHDLRSLFMDLNAKLKNALIIFN